jgi:uncharacterized membrane protein
MELTNRLTDYLFQAKKYTEEEPRPLNAMTRISCLSGGLTLLYQGIKTKKLTLGISGSSLVILGITGYSPMHMLRGLVTGSSGEPIEVSTSMTVNKPRKEVYSYWRNLENLPDFMSHIAQVKNIDDRKSRWKAQWGDTILSWEASIVKDIVNESLAWRSLPSSEIKTFGEIDFKTAPGRRGTEVHLKINYEPMAGPAGKAVAKLITPVLARQIKEDLRNFKRVLETGQRPVEGPQTSGREDSSKDRAA